MRARSILRVVTLCLIFAFGATMTGCASGPQSPEEPDDLYSGYGEGDSLGSAMNAAKMDAVRSAVIDLIGPEAEERNAARLAEILYGTRNPNAFVYNETLETVRKDGSLIDGEMVYELTIRVNIPAVRGTLERNGIIGDPAGVAGAAPAASAPTVAENSLPTTGGSTSPPADLSPAAGDWDEVTPEEERFIRRYVETMTYMVYFSDASVADASVADASVAAAPVKNGAAAGAQAANAETAEFMMRSAVNQANSYLVSDGRVVVDAAQVERLKSDQQLVYEEETGREISLLQWVARRLNADVYIELDAQVTGSTSGDNHYGTADVTLNMYDTSTGQVLGSVNRRSQNSFSRTSEQDAVLNAVQSTVYQAMPRAVEMARNQMARMLTRGIRYEVTIQNPPDARSLSRFRSAMSDHVREIATVSQSPEEVLYEVFAIGSTDDIVDLVYEVSDRVAGFEDLVMVIGRGRALTFDAGF